MKGRITCPPPIAKDQKIPNTINIISLTQYQKVRASKIAKIPKFFSLDALLLNRSAIKILLFVVGSLVRK